MIDFAPYRRREFSLSAARSLVQDCFQVRPAIYWTDFLFSYGLGIYCYQQVRGGSMLVPHQGFTGQPWQAVCFFVSCLCFYRVALFIHELVHQRTSELRVFRFVWNLTCGIPFLMPTFVYYSHIDHHRRAHYGTQQDGEYLPMVHRRPWYVLYYLSWSFLIPIAVVFRFMVLTPLAWMSRRGRRWVHRHASSMVMDPSYIRPLPSASTLRIIRIQELGCFLWCWGIAVLPPVLLHRTALAFAVHAYLSAVVIILLNSLRTLGSHRWANAGGEMTFVEQLLDSVNYPHHGLTAELWAPIGCRYHALHHLFPSMPYHQMKRAHRILMDRLPQDSPYRATNARSLPAAIVQL
ncbi:MAG: fatty acid desaturase, partial [Planctomycetales bacterium]|nr:fatty acid desaturase [Planctomycetales bacterium]